MDSHSDNRQPQISERQSDSKSIQEWINWLSVSKHNGWLVYEQHLKKLIDDYTVAMDNLQAPAELLKHYQLIKKGLKMALNIPKLLEIKAKTVRKNEQKKKPSRIDNFFRVGK